MQAVYKVNLYSCDTIIVKKDKNLTNVLHLIVKLQLTQSINSPVIHHHEDHHFQFLFNSFGEVIYEFVAFICASDI